MVSEVKDGIQVVEARNAAAWRKWLEKNHDKEKSVWLLIYKKDSGIASVYYPEAVDEALCFGWIDSKPNKRDADSYYQFFAKRNPKSNWSRVNKKKVEKLIKDGRMAAAGLEAIATAKKNGTWDALNEVENLVIPDELAVLLSKNKQAQTNWDNFPRSSKRGILEWIASAKREETRNKRIEETVTLAAENIRANHYTNNKK